MLRFAKHDHPKLRTRRALGFGLAILCVAGGSLTACSSTESEMTTTTEAEAGAEAEGTTTTAAPATLPSVSNVFAPPTEAGQDVMVSLSITGGVTQDSLVGVSISEDWAESATLVPDEPVSLVPSQTVNLTKSGAYIQVVGLKKALDLNKPFEITLKFGNSAEQTVQGDVRELSLGSS
jgi:copper(I)-binding protein